MAATVVENAKDLRRLPLRALVAFAARCARRVQPQYTLAPEHLDAAACLESIETAIRMAERFAAAEDVNLDEVAEVEEATVRAILTVSGDENGNPVAAYAANAAYAAISATTSAIEALYSADPSDAGEKVADAAAIAVDAAKAIRDDVALAADLDWEMLHRMRLGKFPFIGEPVNPTESGILGPLFSQRTSASDRRKSVASRVLRESKAKAADPETPDAQDDASVEELNRAVESLRIRQDELKTFEAQLLEQRDALDADRAALNVVNDDLERRRDELERQAAQLESDRVRSQSDNEAAEAAARIQEREAELAGKERESEAKRNRLAAEIEEEKKALLTSTQEAEQAAAEARQASERVKHEQAQIRAQQDELGTRRDELLADERNLQEERQAFQQEMERVRQEADRAAATAADVQRRDQEFEGRRIDLESREASLAERQAKLEATLAALEERESAASRDHAEYDELRAQLDAEQRALQAGCDEVESARRELGEQSEALEAARVAFMEEQARVTTTEADIHKALQQLRDERKRLPPEEDSVKTWSLQQSPKEAVADLQQLLSRLHDERHRMRTERAQLAEIFTLVSSVSGSNAGTNPRPRPYASKEQKIKIDGPRLRMIVDPGTASSAELAELLLELSMLNRALGGPGAEFIVSDCRSWSLSALKSRAEKPGTPTAEAETPAAGARSFVEIYVVPASPVASDAKFSASHWDRFTASLFMVLRLDAGQANYFDLAEAVPREHPARVLAADAAIRAARKSAKSSDGGTKAEPHGMSIDLVNQRLQKIEELRRKLERENSLVVELAPAVEAEAKAEEPPVATPAETPKPKRRNRVKLAIAAAAATVLMIFGGWLYVRPHGGEVAESDAPSAAATDAAVPAPDAAPTEEAVQQPTVSPPSER